MKKIIGLIGKSGAGKDYILDKVMQKYPCFNRLVSDTTRPKREGEVEGLDYYFVTDEEFNEKSYLEKTEYNGWKYGTLYSSIKEGINIGIFNVEGYRAILENHYINFLPIYINTPDKVRMIRCLEREDNPNIDEICRRYFADKKEFEDFDLPFKCETWEQLIEMPIFKDFISYVK